MPDICRMQKLTIAIDGLSSCGKSTLAKKMADRLGYRYIDSGAMYRAITLYFLRNHVDYLNPDEVSKRLEEIRLDFQRNNLTGQSEIYLNGENVEYLIRDLSVAEKVSEVAAVGAVREFAVAAQQELGNSGAIVMDGRDIGTTVFPNADVKIYLMADNEVRVQRRHHELIQKNPETTIEEVRENLEHRDHIDSNREISPLRKADDAIELDNSLLTFDETLQKALEIVKNSGQSSAN